MKDKPKSQQRHRASIEAVERRRANRASLRRHNEYVKQQREKFVIAPVESILSAPIIDRINAIIREMRYRGEIDIDVLDYRFWECLKCRFNPRKIVEYQGETMTVLGWWGRVHPQDRRAVWHLSMKCNRDLTDRRVRLWAKLR